MTFTGQVRQRGTLILPADLREKHGIEPGDTFRLVDLDGIFVLTPMVTMVPELACEIERARVESSLSIEYLLANLREQRDSILQKKDLSGSARIDLAAWGIKKLESCWQKFRDTWTS